MVGGRGAGRHASLCGLPGSRCVLMDPADYQWIWCVSVDPAGYQWIWCVSVDPAVHSCTLICRAEKPSTSAVNAAVDPGLDPGPLLKGEIDWEDVEAWDDMNGLGGGAGGARRLLTGEAATADAGGDMSEQLVPQVW